MAANAQSRADIETLRERFMSSFRGSGVPGSHTDTYLRCKITNYFTDFIHNV